VYLKEGFSDAFLEQCRRIVCGGKDTTINYMRCLMSLTCKPLFFSNCKTPMFRTEVTGVSEKK
jgi:hypothetical protein